jgi:prophage regulatory protein
MSVKNSPALSGRDSSALCLLRLPEVCRRVGISRSELYRRVCARTFPAPIKLGERASAWPEHEVSAWIAARVAERDAKGAA